ncbi:MAG: response regulator [Candidatus Odinarchaeota archaeon]
MRAKVGSNIEIPGMSNDHVNGYRERHIINVLVIVNDVDFLDLSKTYLEKTNDDLSVYTVTAPEQVLPLIETAFYDIIVADYELPRMNGLQLLEKLRKSGNCLPFIMLLDREQEEIAVKGMALGADYCILKAPDINDTFADLNHFISQSTNLKRFKGTVN